MPLENRAPRSRGRARAVSSRPRKSLPTDAQHRDEQAGQAAWEHAAWSASQMPTDQVHTASHTPAGSRRPSSSSGQPMNTTMMVQIQSSQGGSPLSSDPYAHTKKTRTKPIRNADGVLIRKDGRPDMRSQSSAANLRKVHAKKEEERRHDGPGDDPDHPGSRAYSALSTVESSAAQSTTSDSPASTHAEPALHGSDAQGGAASSHYHERQDRHEDAGDRHAFEREQTQRFMNRMLPHGADEQQQQQQQHQQQQPHQSQEQSRPSQPERFYDKDPARNAVESREHTTPHEMMQREGQASRVEKPVEALKQEQRLEPRLDAHVEMAQAQAQAPARVAQMVVEKSVHVEMKKE